MREEGIASFCGWILTRDIIPAIANPDITVLEPRLCPLSEDEVGGARDQTPVIVLLALVR